jgi:ketosteroid isomerase-like protein
MTTDASLTADEVAELRKLLEIEKIRKLRQLYSQLMDGQEIDALAQIMAEDAVCEFGPYGTWHGRKQIHENWKATFSEAIPYGALHFTTNLWIELTGPTTAISRSYLHDVSNAPDPRANPVVWLGIYDEDYEKIDGAWLIKVCRLQFLWPRRITGEDFPRRMTATSLG